jgi:hypothetical protein
LEGGDSSWLALTRWQRHQIIVNKLLEVVDVARQVELLIRFILPEFCLAAIKKVLRPISFEHMACVQLLLGGDSYMS